MKVFVGADHNGFALKAEVLNYLQSRGIEAVDVGDEKLEPEDDFPVFAARAANAVLRSDDADPRAILLCGGGQGMAMAANRHKGIRASVIWDVEEARLTRNDNDSNVLALPSRLLEDRQKAHDIIDTWLQTPFAAAARYVRRNKQLDEL